MNKKEFIGELRKKLGGLPEPDKNERLSFYGEMIDDRIEDGISEESAVAEIGTVDEIVAQITADVPLARLIKEKVRPNRKLKAWEITLLVLGAPLWFSLLVVACSVFLSLYAVLFSLLVSAYAVGLSFACGVLLGLFETAFYFITGNSVGGLFFIGAAFILFGLSVLSGFVCKSATKGVFMLTKKILFRIKSSFVKKEA